MPTSLAKDQRNSLHLSFYTCWCGLLPANSGYRIGLDSFSEGLLSLVVGLGLVLVTLEFWGVPVSIRIPGAVG